MNLDRIPSGSSNLSLHKPVDFTKFKRLPLTVIRLAMTFLNFEQFVRCRGINKFMRKFMDDATVQTDHILKIFERTVLLRERHLSPSKDLGFELLVPSFLSTVFMHELCLDTQLFAIETMRNVYFTKGDTYQPDCPGILKNVRYLGKNNTHAFLWSHAIDSMIPVSLPEGIIGPSTRVTIDEEWLKTDKENAEGCLKELLPRFVLSEIHVSQNKLYMGDESGLSAFAITGTSMQLCSYLRLPLPVNYKIHAIFHMRTQDQDYLYIYSKEPGLNSHSTAISWLVRCDKQFGIVQQFDTRSSNKQFLGTEFCHSTGQCLIGIDKNTSTGTLRAFVPDNKGMQPLWEYNLRGPPIQEIFCRRTLANSMPTPCLKLQVHSEGKFVVVHYEPSSLNQGSNHVDVLDISSGIPKEVLFLDAEFPYDLATIYLQNGVLSARRFNHTVDSWDLHARGKPVRFASFPQNPTSNVVACTTISPRKIRFLQLETSTNKPSLRLYEHTSEKPKVQDLSRPSKHPRTEKKDE